MADAISLSMYGSAGIAPSTLQFPVAKAGLRVFDRAVVIQTLSDPSTRDPNNELLKSTLNEGMQLEYRIAPRNSVICRLITNGAGLAENSDIVCFPFFSSHIMMPIKPGEQVWVLKEQPELSTGRYFWVSRIAEPVFVEDANFTHGDRRTQKIFKGTLNDSDTSGNFDDPRILRFQNGESADPSVATIAGDQSAFFDIIETADEATAVIYEPVPRMTKRPGDLVLQGSNNSSIRLGTTMGFDSAVRPLPTDKTSIAMTVDGVDVDRGCIDIVAGRGRIFQSFADEKKVSKINKEQPAPDKSTRPFIEENELGEFETDKNIVTLQDTAIAEKMGNSKSNPHEGDPDFLMDASRVFVSSNANIDLMLDTGLKGIAKKFDTPIADMSGPSVAVKSDHIRIVARKSKLAKNAKNEPKDIDKLNPPSNGSIRIIKEGEPDTDLAMIVIEPDGTIQISGSKIFLGRTKDDGGEGDGPGDGKSQPYVKYSELDLLLNKTFDDLKDFVTKLQTNFNSNTTPGFGGPNPALIKSATDECTVFLSAIEKRRGEIVKLKSKRIFGE